MSRVFSYVYFPSVYLLWWDFQICCPFLLGYLYYYWVWLSLLSDICFVNFFFPLYGITFVSLRCVFCNVEFLIFTKCHLSIVSLIDYGFGVFKSSLQTQGHPDILLCYLRKVLYFRFRSVINLELIFVKCMRLVFRLIFLNMWMSSCSSTICWKPIISLLNFLCFFIQDQLIIFLLVYLWALYSVSSTYLTILSLLLHCFDYCTFIVSLQVE